MDRSSLYFIKDNENIRSFDFDNSLPSLPLPDLHDTMVRYFESLLPFGTKDELINSQKIIENFEKGEGLELQQILKERAAKSKNWISEWWDAYGYHMLRIPLSPYVVMVMPFKLDGFGATETQEFHLKNFARILYHSFEFWELIHKAKLKPLSSDGGKIKYSSALYKHFYSTTRVPGEKIDHIEKHFRTYDEGETPQHCLISGKGRLFIFNATHEDGTLLTPQEILIVLQRIRSTLDYEPLGDCVPILTHDGRDVWAKNRNRLMEVSPVNKETLKLVESANIVAVFDEHEPVDYTEVAQFAAYGDYHSRWGDRTSNLIAYKNGKFACIGEHSAYDGTISVSYAVFIQLSLHESPEHNWSDIKHTPMTDIIELKFDLDNHLRTEIARVTQKFIKQGHDVLVEYTTFIDFGKDSIKDCKLHPDSFVQVAMQLTYLRLHNEIASTYETALMRQFFNGRTETLRSCTKEVHRFLEGTRNKSITDQENSKNFRCAVEHHNFMMNEMRKGRGIDRHLFGLWCAAYENERNIPELYSDPLYTKSGGGGNFLLSTSTLGYSVNVGYVAPMSLDGYGVFYSITSDTIYIISAVYRDSTKTSAHRFNEMFKETLREMHNLIKHHNSKF